MDVSMRYMKYSIILFLIILLSCSGSKETVVPETKPTVYDESFDPTVLDDEDIVISPDTHVAPGSKVAVKTGADKEKLTEMPGFRVQIIALTDPVNASLVEQEAREQFAINGHKTYSIFETPFIKIRVGDCPDRRCAEELRELARDQFGYKEAQIIRTTIQLPESSE
jgi:hypothetical protein